MKEIISKVDRGPSIVLHMWDKEVLRVAADGAVWWLKDGQMVKAEVDAELAQAFAFVVLELAGMPTGELIKKIREGR